MMWVFVSYCTIWSFVGQLFSLGTPVFSTNNTDHYNIAEILLKVASKHHTLTYKTEISIF